MVTALIVEDSLTDRERLTHYLQQSGITVVGVTSSEEALLKVQSKLPDISIVVSLAVLLIDRLFSRDSIDYSLKKTYTINNFQKNNTTIKTLTIHGDKILNKYSRI